jgi:hypothetical protein
MTASARQGLASGAAPGDGVAARRSVPFAAGRPAGGGGRQARGSGG